MNDTRGPAGLFVHATDTVEAHDLTKEWIMQPALMIAIVLEGTLSVKIDGYKMRLGRAEGACGYFWNLTKAARIVRQSQAGTHIRKVVIRVPSSWIDLIIQEDTAAGRELPWVIKTHCATGHWTPSSHALALAEQLINQKENTDSLQVLVTESRGAEIAREALSSILQTSPIETTLAETRQTSKARTIRDYVSSHLSQHLSLNDLSLRLGMSVGSMQSAFKRTYHKTIGDFMREQRLDLARVLIEQQGLTVSQAGYKAGYDSPASFSTAFKRQFGFSPSDCKS